MVVVLEKKDYDKWMNKKMHGLKGTSIGSSTFKDSFFAEEAPAESEEENNEENPADEEDSGNDVALIEDEDAQEVQAHI